MLAQLMPTRGGLASSQSHNSCTDLALRVAVARTPPEREPMLVTVEFPDDLAIAARWIEKGDGDQATRGARRPCTG
jgi:hypothetical protein